MGIIYLGPVDGSDIGEMCRIFEEAKRVDGPVLVHVITKRCRISSSRKISGKIPRSRAF